MVILTLAAGSVSVSPTLTFDESDGTVEVCAILSVPQGTTTANDIMINLAVTPGL